MSLPKNMGFAQVTQELNYRLTELFWGKEPALRVLRISHSAVVDAWRERERALERLGAEVTTITAQSWNEGGATVRLKPRADEKVEGVATVGSHPALFLYNPAPLWRALAEEWDVIDIHEEPFALATAEVLALRALRRRRAPYSLYSAQNIRKRYPVPFRWLERWSLRHAAGMSVCNSAAGLICQDKGFPGRARVIPLGIDLRSFRPAAAGSHDAQRPSITVGYAGRLAPHKGVDVLLEAIAGDGRLTLRLAGSGPSESDLRQKVDRWGIAGRVEFCGSLAQGDLPTFYGSLDVLAVPSLTTPSWVEQFGRVAVEAMACGVPVVASDSGALPDVVGGAGLLVPPGDAAALRDALVLVGTDPELATRLRAAGLGRASSCDWEAVAQEYLRMYQAMLHQPAVAATRGVEVVVVAYGAPALLRRALAPVRSLPVTVVDNTSMPEIRSICDEFGCRYLDPGRNVGFAAGVNLALAHRQVPAADVLLLNPDAEISVDGIAQLQAALHADPTLASVAPSQIGEAGEPARIGWPFPSPARTWQEALGLGSLGRQADFVIGSVLLLRAEALDQVGGLDERFFLYAEETDWAYRAARLGWHHREVPEVTAFHAGAATSSDPDRREAHFHASQERYLRKHYGALGWSVARAGQVLGSLARSAALPSRRRNAWDRARRYLRGPVRLESEVGS